MPEESRPELLVFADDWGRHPSSCQHLVQRLRGDYRILWANTIGTRSPRADRLTIRRGVEKLRSWGRGLQAAGGPMWVIDLPMIPKMDSAAIARLNRLIVGRRLRRALAHVGMHRPKVLTTVPFVGPLIAGVPHRSMIYYCTDDYSQWPGADRAALAASEEQTARESALILAVSKPLEMRLSEYGHTRYFPHGVDCHHFGKVPTSPAAEPLTALPRPRIGFFGLIYEKLDFGLLTSIATRFSTGSLVLIGRVDYCPEGFRALSNVHVLGPQPYETLPRWLAGFDVLLMPYVNDEMIRQSCPLKLRECLASGKPTVSVEVPEVRKFEGHVLVARNAQEFIGAIERALSEQPADAIQARQAAVAGDDWSARAQQLRAFIDSVP